MSDKEQTRCGFIALAGAPNAGKSTLLNQLVGQKISIVTHKVQTTRAVLRAAIIVNYSQLIFVDTPGIFDPIKRLERAMVTAAWSGVRDADVVVLIVDCASKQHLQSSFDIAKALSEKSRTAILVLNKIDLIDRAKLLKITAQFSDQCNFDATFMLSALSGDGVDDLKIHLSELVPVSPWMYPEDHLTDLPMRMLASEITREKLFLNLHDELPYALSVETESWRELKDGSVRVEQTIYVQRESQRAIVLGRGGQQIKNISSVARSEIGKLIDCTVHLFLFVKVRPKWTDDPARYRGIGLDFDRETL